MFRTGFILCALLATLQFPAAGQAVDPTPTPTPEPTPVPNTTALSRFEGRYRGVSKISIDSGTLYLGSSKTRISLPTATSLKVEIDAEIKAGGRTIPVGNQIVFTPGGVVRGRNLAPGVLDNARFDGLYTATARRIEFSGTYEIRKLTGRFNGTFTAGRLGRFTLRYSILPGESTIPAYIYQYSGELPGGRD